jgi:phosphoglycolate phosphatase
MSKCIIFDLDGTLIDTLPNIANAMNSTLENFGFESKELTTYQSLIGGGSKSMVQYITPQGVDVEAIYSYYLEEYQNTLTKDTTAYPQVHSFLKVSQAKGIKLAVVTNKHHEHANSLLASIFPDIKFSAVFGLVNNASKKPSPETSFKALKQLGKTANEAIFVGDTLTDMKTAKAAGINSIFVEWGYGDKQSLYECPPVHSIKNINELASLV